MVSVKSRSGLVLDLGLELFFVLSQGVELVFWLLFVNVRLNLGLGLVLGLRLQLG
jgi:hypothetical protein